MRTSLVFVGTVAVLISILSRGSSHSEVESPELRSLFMKIRDIQFNVTARSNFQRRLNRAAELGKLQRRVDDSIPFPCNTTNTRSPTRPESVHKLRPGDIDVIATMGDSLTAATGALATSFFDLLIDNRGVSYSGGGQGTWREYLTLPNIIKKFNPNLVGYSYGDSTAHNRDSQLNMAVINAISGDTMYMAMVLVKRIKSDKRIDFEKDWKLVTIMIGPNNFCGELCYQSREGFNQAGEVHRKELAATLDYLRDNLPRTLVNVILVPNLQIQYELKGKPDFCRFINLVECTCLHGIIRGNRYWEMVEKMKEWQQVEREVVADIKYRTKKDFAVVLQPFTARLTLPEVRSDTGNITDYSLFSIDCLHFSQKGHARIANALWNNMMEPLGQKSEDWTETFSRFLCPTEEHPYIYTYGNS